MRISMGLLNSPLHLAAIGALLALGYLTLRRDIFPPSGRRATLARAPRALTVALCSSGVALLIIFLYRYSKRFGLDASWLFVKEGPLEDFTFAAELAATLWMGVAASRTWRRRRDAARMLVAGAYAICAAMLFVIAMEEIAWGQQFMHFATPEGWSQLNHQHETTLHNLIDKSTLTNHTRIAACLLAAGALFLTILQLWRPMPLTAALAPHPALIPLALLIGYAGVRLHAEIVEAFVALYFLFYGRQAFYFTGMLAPPSRPADALEGSAATDRSHARRHSPFASHQTGVLISDILDLTYDAIIIWEMDGQGVVYWNNAAEQIYGYSPAEVLGQTTHALLKTQLEGGVDKLETTVARYGVWAGELRHTTKSGRQIVVQSRLALMAQHTGGWLVLEVNRALETTQPAADVQRAVEAHLANLRAHHGSELSP
ncbi:MAG TPA: PAS domain-containing protein [Steroidobacter sp.]|jgi:PAS domain S-box-containing protein|nr:PAS domain-containing protein [Steroidobacter sp.]